MKPLQVKTAGEWELEVLGIPYGGPDDLDSDGEYFSPNTKLWEDRHGLPPAVYYHGLDEDGKPAGMPEYIGKTVSYEDRDDGRWYRVVLDKASDYARRVWEAAKQGAAVASSGAISHLARIAPDGHILSWPVGELSLFDTDNGKAPANRHAIAVPVMKSMYPEYLEEAEHDAEAARKTALSAEADADTDNDQPNSQEEQQTMSEQEQQNAAPAVDVAAIAAEAAKAAAVEAADAAVERYKARVEEERQKAAAQEPPVKKAGVDSAPNLNLKTADTMKYDNYDAADLAFAGAILDGAHGANRRVSPPRPAMMKAIAQRLESEEARRDENLNVAARYMKSRGIKADETNFSTNASYGDEWVGVAYSGDLWEKVRLNTFVVDRLNPRVAPPGSESIVFPIEGTDPVWYKVAQAGDPTSSTAQVTNTVPAKALGTGSVTATLAKMGTSVIYTGEMVEDAVLDFAATLRMKLAVSGAEHLESAIIDGDTETSASTNINDIAGTPASTDYFLLWDGFRKLALVTNTANSRSGGTFAADDFILTARLMGDAGIDGMDMNRVSFIIDPLTHYAALNIEDVKTRDVFTGATLESGRLTGIYGYEVLTSGQLAKKSSNRLTNTAGKVDQDTTTNNTKGQILAVRWDQWRFGYRRNMSIEVERIPRADAYEITALMRAYFQERANEAAAITYNLTV